MHSIKCLQILIDRSRSRYDLVVAGSPAESFAGLSRSTFVLITEWGATVLRHHVNDPVIFRGYGRGPERALK